MSNPSNIFDFASEDLAAFLAKAIGDGTMADVFQTLKIDQPGLEVPATAIRQAFGQILGNGIDDFILAAYPLLRSWANYVPPAQDYWEEIADIDMTGNLSVLGNGPIVINGWNWEVFGFAAASSIGGVADGFEIEATGNVSYNGGATDTAPRILLDLATEVPEFTETLDRPIEIWAQFDSGSIVFPNSQNCATVGLSADGSGITDFALGTGPRNLSGSIGASIQHNTSFYNADQSFSFDTTKFRMRDDSMAFGFAANSPGGWPSLWPETIARVLYGSSSSNSILFRQPASQSPKLYFCVSTNTATAGDPYAKLKRIRIMRGRG